MKVKLENREYELKANGKFMKKYQEQFGENMIVSLYKCASEKDMFTCAKLVYSAIDETMTFDEWLDSFETPLFLMSEMENVIEYLIRTTEPTVKPNGDGSSQEPKKKN